MKQTTTPANTAKIGDIPLNILGKKRINIAIDGHAGCGKSTTAKQLARRLGYIYIDTGAMYRIATLVFLRDGIPFDQENPMMLKSLETMEIDFVHNAEKGICDIRLDGLVMGEEIRTPEVSAQVSPVSIHKVVRQAMVKQQQRIAANKGVVMDGRDIGTVVIPDAELKVFMTADVEIRAKRRLMEMEKKGLHQPYEEVLFNLRERDRIDSTRIESPLKQAADARVLDTTHLHIDDQVEQVLAWAKAMIEV